MIDLKLAFYTTITKITSISFFLAIRENRLYPIFTSNCAIPNNTNFTLTN